ncbi:T9SS type A sorting domain-containing protein [Flavobacterium sp.]|uniref:T9SS type A sorting domain-containing protein n=1 Tax=Flavobacterium sp. TaxID=239 RepID=UPI002B4B6A67|nr:T9SS type A sorting domain-containing protein [Flavobacterium sp.]HLP65614.1 T9SS type A sorting domain-containing protein [Flavobacterium sp.]
MKMKLQLSITLFFALASSLWAQVSSEKETQARQWIKDHSTELHINPNQSFNLRAVRKTEFGETLRFQQMLNNVPVFDTEVLVHYTNNEVTSSAVNYDANVTSITTVPSLSKENAIAISNNELKIDSDVTFQECNLFVYNKLESTKLVYRVVTTSFNKIGSWETIIDAQNGTVLSVKDIAFYYKSKRHNASQFGKPVKCDNPFQKTVSYAPLAFVTGTAMVFNPDPLSQAGVAYNAAGYTDGNDANTTQLNNARVSVTLPEIDLTAGVYRLKSSYADIRELGSPAKGLFTQATSDFSFNRNQDGFEAANAFYHIDKSMRYINQTLGITCVPYQSANAGLVWYDPHGANSADNSFYSNGQLQFGEGGVDDAEDADVVLHELGHGLHDWITSGGLSQVNGLSEGCGDYWAQSYSRSLNQWTESDAAYHYMFSWDGHNPFWPGRITNYSATYPGGLVGQIHTDGQIWATALMTIWDVLGREKTDKAFLNGLDLTVSSTNQQNAAIAVRTAAMNMNYPCSEIQVITEKFTDAGYTMPSIALRMNAIPNQTVQADASNTYTLPSYAELANPITNNCDAVLTQTPNTGTVVGLGDHLITMVATSGASTVTRTFTLTVTPSLGVDENVKKNIVVYPNPTSSNLTIQGEFDSQESITIFNLLGQKVMEHTIDSNEQVVNVSKLASGVYTIYFNSSKATFKFIKE